MCAQRNLVLLSSLPMSTGLLFAKVSEVYTYVYVCVCVWICRHRLEHPYMPAPPSLSWCSGGGGGRGGDSGSQLHVSTGWWVGVAQAPTSRGWGGGCHSRPRAVELLLAASGFSPVSRLWWESGKLILVRDVEQCLGHNDHDLSGSSYYDYPHLQGQANQCLAGKFCLLPGTVPPLSSLREAAAASPQSTARLSTVKWGGGGNE